MDALTAILAFAGAALGSAVGYRATAGATKVEREARRREEWGRRFTSALEAATSADARPDAGSSRKSSVVSESDSTGNQGGCRYSSVESNWYRRVWNIDIEPPP